jgi:hypothetical protein
MQLCFRLLEDRCIDSKVTTTQDLEDLVAYGLRIFGGVEHLVEVNAAPAKLAT